MEQICSRELEINSKPSGLIDALKTRGNNKLSQIKSENVGGVPYQPF